ncbi:hypothetical protein D2E64_13555 [Mycobacteroides abscessus]|uniref:hypothetical protein n=1 Tax=Mycobacteroides abscessus TaxID=36809 RepID=UPI000C25BAAE|nr:hypothetical protein [Mycobacteroides abscessus]PVA22811.1 hypothetical protein DDJ61_04040 [Mycobacteroides abscessus]PVA83882.1 hypothetical protein DDJ76_13975 [Mycobacteroides abscessus]RIR96144.1 hypothetical protein D2E50_00545 [Mycobacteroides abscessus]RIS07958.1 hypothetical protein D2E63_15315 [Mycobacteroides abscessus]RIS15962.1 hypothetical protein D2E69_17105 [Mycobacteroides abscessus]
MSQHFLVTVLVLVSIAAIGLFTLALLLRWRDQQAAYRQATERHRRLVAIRRTRRQAEQRIDHLTLAAIEHLLTTTRRTDLQ